MPATLVAIPILVSIWFAATLVSPKSAFNRSLKTIVLLVPSVISAILTPIKAGKTPRTC